MDSDSSLTELSSDLSDVGSMSPPPFDYPSPALTQEAEVSDVPASQSKKRGIDSGEQQPAKKRRRSEPKPRRTDILDLTGDMNSEEQKDGLEKLLKVLRKRRKIVVIAGAGISVSAGIPDFRSSTGLFKTLKGEHKLKASGKQLFDASVYQTDSSTSTFHDMVRQLSEQVKAAEPTVFHKLLDTLSMEERLLRLYTQNVDGLEVNLPFLETNVPLNAKGPWPKSIQLHGGLQKMACSKCSAIADFETELFDGPEPPPCTRCMEADRIRTDHAGKRSHGVGKMRPRMALYNERAPDEDAIGAVMASDLRSRPDALIVVGTSLKIPGVKRLVREMCGVIRDKRDGLTIWMNMDEPPEAKEFKDCWDLVVKGPCDAAVKLWEQDHSKDQSGSDTEKEAIKSPAKKGIKATGSLPSPSLSPLGSDVECEPRLKLLISNNKIKTCVKMEPKKQAKAGASVAIGKKIEKDTKKPESKSRFKKIKPSRSVEAAKKVMKMERNGMPRKGQLKDKATLDGKFKISKPTARLPVVKGATPKKEPISSPLSSPVLPSWTPSLAKATLSKGDPSQTPLFPNTYKNSSNPNRSFSTPHPAAPPRGLHLRSSPPPHEPLSSPVKIFPARGIIATGIRIPANPVSRPGSSGSANEGTISPTSRPRGMEGLID